MTAEEILEDFREHGVMDPKRRAALGELLDALREWRRQNPAPDCTACAVLDAATCGTPTE